MYHCEIELFRDIFTIFHRTFPFPDVTEKVLYGFPSIHICFFMGSVYSICEVLYSIMLVVAFLVNTRNSLENTIYFSYKLIYIIFFSCKKKNRISVSALFLSGTSARIS